MPRKSYTIPVQVQQRLDLMVAYWGGTETAILHRAIDWLFKEYSKEKFGYRGADLGAVAVKKEVRKEKQLAASAKEQGHIDLMTAMTDDELTAHLRDLEYFPAPEKIDEDIWTTHKIVTVGNQRQYHQDYINRVTGENTYHRVAWETFEDIVADLRKEKKLGMF